MFLVEACHSLFQPDDFYIVFSVLVFFKVSESFHEKRKNIYDVPKGGKVCNKLTYRLHQGVAISSEQIKNFKKYPD